MTCFIQSACDSKAKLSEINSLNKDAGRFNSEEKIDKNENAAADIIADTTQQSPGGEPDQQKKPAGNPEKKQEDWDKKIVKTATLNLEVKDYKIYYNRLREKLRGLGGYIAQEDQTESDYKIENAVVIKVPVDQFDNALAELNGDGDKLNEKKISSQDVTGEYVDTKSRLEAKKQVRLRYLDLLKQARNMEEILNVQSEINDIQEEIEAAAGRIDYLSHAAAYSTINLTYYQVLNASAKNTDNPGIGAKITSAFKQGWGWIVDLFVGLVSIWPLFVLLFILVIIYRRTKTQKVKAA